MLQLIASSAQDGWALIEDDEKAVWLIRPPYDKNHREKLSLGGAERAVRDGGYFARELTLPGWNEVVMTLIHEQQEAGSPQDLVDAQTAAAEILKLATEEQIRVHLNTIRERGASSSPSRSVDALKALADAPVVLSNSELMRECLELLFDLQGSIAIRPDRSSLHAAWGVSDDDAADGVDQAFDEQRNILPFEPLAA